MVNALHYDRHTGYEDNQVGYEALALGPEMLAMMGLLARSYTSIARGLSPYGREPKDSAKARYRDEFRTVPVVLNLGFPRHKRAGFRIVQDSAYAASVEATYAVMTRSIAALKI